MILCSLIHLTDVEVKIAFGFAIGIVALLMTMLVPPSKPK